MSHDDAIWAAFVDEVLNRVRTEVGELRADFGPRHDRIIAEFAETRRELAEARQERDDLRKQLDEAVRRIAELEGRSDFVEAIAQYLGRAAANGQLPPELITAITGQTPRPPSIDRACAADPNGPAQRVDLPQHGKTVYPKPGSDPEVTWSSIAGLGEGTADDAQKKTHHSHRARRH